MTLGLINASYISLTQCICQQDDQFMAGVIAEIVNASCMSLNTCIWQQEDGSMNGSTLGLFDASCISLINCICQQEDESLDGITADDAAPASAVRERYERMFREKQRSSKGPGPPGDLAAAALVAQGQAVRTAFQGSISSVFTKHLR